MHFPDITIRDQQIKLGQFVKLANLVDTGGVAKELIASGAVLVNDQVDTRRGKTLRAGDVVTIVDQESGQVVCGARVRVTIPDAAVDHHAAPKTDGETDADGGHTSTVYDPHATVDTLGDGLTEEDLGDFFDETTADDGFDPEKWRNM